MNRKKIDGKWYLVSVDGKQLTEDENQNDQLTPEQEAEQKAKEEAEAKAKADAEAANGGVSAAEVEKAAKMVAEKIAEYQKLQAGHTEKMAKINGQQPSFVDNSDVKLFTTRRGANITMKQGQIELLASWFKHFVLFNAKGNPDSYYKMQEARVKLEPMVTTAAADGGNLVPTILHNAIVPLIEDMAVMRPNATVLDMTNIKTLDVPTIGGKPVMTLNGEALQKGSSSMQFGKFTLTPYNLAAIVPITQELIDYSPFNVVQILSQAFAEATAKAEDKLFFEGTGSSQPKGIDAYTFAKTIAAGGLLSWTHLNNAYFGVNQYFRSRGFWFMGQEAMANLANQKDSQNRPIFDVAGVFSNDGLPTIKGRPVLEQNDIGGKIFFGDPKAYWIGATRQLKIDIAKEATIRGQNLWERNMIAVRCEERIDGQLSDTRAFSEINGL